MVHYDRPGDDISRGLVGYWKLDDLKRVPSDGIVAHYKMNDNAANTIVIDSKGGNNGVSSVNTSLLTGVGKINEALDFTGTTDHVDLDSTISFTGAFTISTWINSAAFDSTYRFFISKDVAGSVEKLGHNNNGLDFFIRVLPTGSGDTSVTLPSAGAWHLITITRNLDNKIDLYINNGSANRLFSDVAQVGTSSWNKIAATGTSSDPWNGKIDDVRFYNRGLSLSEIGTIYNSGTGTETTELFRDTVVAIDRANFNDGTINGATNTEGVNGLNPDAMFFDGVDDYVAINKNILTYPIDFSIALWIKDGQPVGGESWPKYFDAGRGGNAAIGNYGFAIMKDKVDTIDQAVQFVIRTTDADNTNIETDVDKNVWTHIVGTKVGTSVKLYKNGVLVGSDTLTQEEYRESHNTYLASAAGGAQRVNAGMSNIRLYNRGLTPGQISKLHRLRK